MTNKQNDAASCSGGDAACPEVARRAAERVPGMIKAGLSQREILTSLVAAAEQVSGGGAVASILVLDDQGLLRNAASPNLPADYLDAIDRLKPNARVGTCAAAAATGCVVITPDFSADDKWAELRHLPAAIGFVAAWSMPIKTSTGKVLGTFGTYFREKRRPRAEEVGGKEVLVAAAAMALGEESTKDEGRSTK